jgi:hypothetical protein
MEKHGATSAGANIGHNSILMRRGFAPQVRDQVFCDALVRIRKSFVRTLDRCFAGQFRNRARNNVPFAQELHLGRARSHQLIAQSTSGFQPL